MKILFLVFLLLSFQIQPTLSVLLDLSNHGEEEDIAAPNALGALKAGLPCVGHACLLADADNTHHQNNPTFRRSHEYKDPFSKDYPSKLPMNLQYFPDVNKFTPPGKSTKLAKNKVETPAAAKDHLATKHTRFDDDNDTPGPRVCKGNYKVANDDVIEFEVILGDLIIQSFPADGGLATFQHIKKVTGKIVVEGTVLAKSLVFTGLTQAHGIQITENSNLESISLPSLDLVGGHIQIEKNQKLKSLKLPKLRSALDNIQINGNQNLEKIDFPEFKTAGGIQIENNQELKSLYFPVIKYIDGALRINSNDNLESLSFDKLETIEQYGRGIEIQSFDKMETNEYGGIEIKNNQKLESASFPELITSFDGFMKIEENPKLNLLSFPKLFGVEGIKISSNMSLKSLSFPKLLVSFYKVNIDITAHLDNVDFQKIFPVLRSSRVESVFINGININSLDYARREANKVLHYTRREANKLLRRFVK